MHTSTGERARREADHDTSGQSRLVANVLASWAGYAVYIAAGFVMPRMIDRHLGQVQLGLWDFVWSLVTSLRLAQLGVASSSNRFVAQHRAVGDVDGLNRAVSSVAVIQVVAALAAVAATVALAVLAPALFGRRLGAHADEVRWVILAIGAGVSLDMACDVFRGVLSGCHRWDLLNLIDAASYAASVAGMLVALSLGGDLRWLAVVYTAGLIVQQAARMWAAFHVCPELRPRARDATWTQAKQMLAFGGKSAVHGMSRLVLVQANSLLVAASLGPSMLAVYSRPGALVRHLETIVNKMAFVLVPTASALQASGRPEDLRRLLLESSRYAACLALPSLLFLAVLADSILSAWMGDRYRAGPVLVILAAGYFLPLAQQPAVSILRGLNVHGWIAAASVASALAGVLLGVVFVTMLGWSLIGAALAVALPLTLGNGLFIGAYACRQLGIPPGEYTTRVFLQPAALVAPFGAALALIQVLAGHRPWAALACACVAAVVLLLPLYWAYVLPPSMRSTLRARLRRRGGVTAASGTP